MKRSGDVVPAALNATAAGIGIWFRVTFIDLGRQLRWSYLPPLRWSTLSASAFFSSLTAIVGTFFLRQGLSSLSAAFLAGLTFWPGIPCRHMR